MNDKESIWRRSLFHVLDRYGLLTYTSGVKTKSGELVGKIGNGDDGIHHFAGLLFCKLYKSSSMFSISFQASESSRGNQKDTFKFFFSLLVILLLLYDCYHRDITLLKVESIADHKGDTSSAVKSK